MRQAALPGVTKNLQHAPTDSWSGFVSDAHFLERKDARAARRHLENMRFFETDKQERPETGFLDVNIHSSGPSSFRGGHHHHHHSDGPEVLDNNEPEDLSPEEEKSINMAQDAESMSDKVEISVRRSVAFAEDACAGSLTAAQVALATEVIAMFGGVAGIAGAWFAWKQDDSELPDELQVPDVGRAMPPCLMKPPPDRKISVSFGANRSNAGASGSASGLRMGTSETF